MSRTAKLLVLMGVLVFVGVGVWTWQRFGPDIGVLVHDSYAARGAFANVPEASVEDVCVSWTNGRKVLVIQWRDASDRNEQELIAGCDAAWAEIAPNLEGKYDSVLIAAVVGKRTEVDLGVVSAHYSNRRAAVYRAYGQQLGEEVVTDLLDDD